jgi:hypothetical protein
MEVVTLETGLFLLESQQFQPERRRFRPEAGLIWSDFSR